MRPEHWLYTIPLRLRSLFRWAQTDQELDDELRDHLERKTGEYVAQGMTQEETHRRARLDLGGIEQTKEKCRDARRVNWIQDLIQDLHFGLRTLRNSPSHTAVAVLTLALGIGVTASALTVCRATILQPLSVPEPESVVRLFFLDDTSVSTKFTFRAYLELKDNASVFTNLAAYHLAAADISERPLSASVVSSNSLAQSASIALVSGNYFALLGGKTTIGRTFGPDEELPPGAHPVMVLSYSFWNSRLGRDEGILGRTIAVRGHPFTVIGIAKPDFHGIDPEWPDAWIPLGMQHEVEPDFDGFTNERGRWLYFVGRLSPGVQLEQAQAVMRLVARRWEQENPEQKNARILVTVGSMLNAESRGRILPIISLAFFAVGLVLMVACANTSNLLLARAVSRQREIGMRLALGASRSRLVRQLLTESVVLGLLAGAAGLVLSKWATRAMYLALSHVAHRLLAELDFRIDGWVLAATMVVSLATVVVFGLAPALQATRLNVVSALKEEGSALHNRIGASRLRNMLVVGQVAFSLILIVAAGLFIRALVRSQSFDLGFNARNLLILTSDLQRQGYSETRADVFYHTVATRLTSLPGVKSVTLARVVPASDLYLEDAVQLEGQGHPAGSVARVTCYDLVSPNYFASMQIPIVRGRVFSTQTAQDNLGVVVNETFVHQFLPGIEPIGTHVRVGDTAAQWLEILGVVKDTMHGRPGEPAPPIVFRPLMEPYPLNLSFLVRTVESPAGVTAALSSEVRALDAQLAFSLSTLQEIIRNAMWPAQVGVLLASTLGALAMALAAVGLFGVVGYNVHYRTREVAIRMAFGASRAQVFRLVLPQALRPVMTGAALGLIGALVLSRFLTAFLFGLSPWDPVAFAGCVSLLALVTLLAAYIPARRATKVDPMIALRYE
jgi:predicted permease